MNDGMNERMNVNETRPGDDNVPLELEGAKLSLYKVAVQHLLTPRGRTG